jgi:hypothetical protein
MCAVGDCLYSPRGVGDKLNESIGVTDIGVAEMTDCRASFGSLSRKDDKAIVPYVCGICTMCDWFWAGFGGRSGCHFVGR